ncbi:MAG TPA: extracellular solute-binding protein [Roseiarcus sp.]|nr:extracellular solute-binding protein [Roseiarcus sp.]
MRARFGLSIGAFALAMLASSAASADPVAISFLTHWPPETVAKLKAATDAYSKAHPDVKIDIRAVPFGDLLTTIRSQGASANGPTIDGIYDLWLPELARDKLAAPAPADVASDVAKNWPKGVQSAASVDGALYGIPNEIDLYTLNYNKKLFAEAGIAGPPKTWAELESDAEKLTKKSGGATTQQGFGLINSWAAGVVHPFASLLASNGGALIEGGKPALDSKQAGETFALYEKLIKSGASVPAMGTADANTTGPFLDNFVSGKTAMIIMANWWESALKAGMKDNFKDIATAPIPVGPSGDAAHSISYSWMTVVNAKAEPAAQKAAWDFLAWLNGPTSGPHGASAMGDILMSMGILPSRTSDVAAFKDKLDSPFLSAYVAALPEARPFPDVLGGQEFTEALQQHIEAVEFGKESAAAAQKAAQEDAVSILTRAAK